MKTRLALFDLDGTLYDTRRVNFLSYQKALEQFGYTMDYEYFANQCNGRHYKTFLPEIMQSETHMEEVHELKKKYYGDFLSETVENKHLFEIIKAIRNEYYIVLVTTASRKNSEDILKYHNRLDEFDLIISQEECKKEKTGSGKEFVKAMDYYKISKDNTIIFEDSDVGIEAAEKSGASVFVVRGFA
mgnify:CR=1 FL=1